MGIKRGIGNQVTAVLGCFQAANVMFRRLCKRFGVVGVSAHRLHIYGDPRLIFTDKLQHNLIQVRTVITTVPLHQNDAFCLVIIGEFVLTIHVKTRDIKVNGIGF